MADLDQMTEIIANTPDDFEVYSGDDGLTLPVLAIGGAGVVSVASHVIGNEMQEMIQAFLAGDYKKAQNYIKIITVDERSFQSTKSCAGKNCTSN